MKTLVWVEHDGSAVKDATLAVVTAASKLGEVHLLVAGSGVDAVAKEAAGIAGVGRLRDDGELHGERHASWQHRRTDVPVELWQRRNDADDWEQ